MDAGTAAVIWDEAFLGYELGAGHPLNPIRLDLTMRLSRALGVLRDVPMLPATPATDVELGRGHTAGYIDAVRRIRPGDVDLDHGIGTDDNPAFERMHEASARIVGGSLAAARRIATGETSRAVNIAGGLHHAMRDRAAGFCVYNDCVVAISWLLDHGLDRVAYVDMDVHHGDGVQAAFWDDPRVLTISLHQQPMTLWPGTGYAEETGGPGAVGTAVNLALPVGTGEGGWLRAFHAVVPPLLGAFAPSVLVTQCGVDTHWDDPLAELTLTVDGHRAIYRSLRALAERHAHGRWLALGGGGYSPVRVVPRSWTHLLATVLDRDVAPNTPLPADWVAHASALARRPLLTSMTDGVEVSYRRWGKPIDAGDNRLELLDEAVRRTRRAAFPAYGLDPDDPHD